MAPKKKEVKVTKADQAKKAKAAEDLTFGLKNKNKSKKVQQFVQQVTHQATGNNKSKEVVQKEKDAVKKEKQLKEQQALLLNTLFKGMNNKKEGPAAGKMMDRDEVRERQKIDLYKDPREKEGEEVDYVELQKKLATTTGNTKTSITCKFFLDAAESQKYGWFWKCPNGEACIYKHCLPPGYVLKKDRQKDDVDDPTAFLEEDIEMARSKLSGTGTPINEATFKEWAGKMKKAREIELKKLLAEQKAGLNKKKTKKVGAEENPEKSEISGKDLFLVNPELFVDDEGAVVQDDMQEDEEYLTQMQAEEEQIAKDHFRLQNEMREAAQELEDEIDYDQFAGEDLDNVEL